MCYNFHQEAEQKRLESEMQKRRERIEQWRTVRNKDKEIIPIVIAPPSRKWTLEDDDDDDDDNAGNHGDGEDDFVDSLDAYMQVGYILYWLLTVMENMRNVCDIVG